MIILAEKQQSEILKCFWKQMRKTPAWIHLFATRSFQDSWQDTMVLKLLDKLLKKYHPQMYDRLHMEVGFCKKWKKYDSVLVPIDEYIDYCKCACLPLDKPKEV